MDQIVLAIPTHLMYNSRMSDKIKAYIYESPDGGDTIYRRESGSFERELIRARDREMDNQWLQWIPILRDSRDDPALKEMLDRARNYWILKAK